MENKFISPKRLKEPYFGIISLLRTTKFVRNTRFYALHNFTSTVSSNPHHKVLGNTKSRRVSSINNIVYLVTLSSRQYEMRRERECEGYIHLISHTLNLFSSHLIALIKISVNRTRVKGHECLNSLLKLLSNTLVQFSNIIYLILGRIVNFFNSLEGFTFASGIYATHIN